MKKITIFLMAAMVCNFIQAEEISWGQSFGNIVKSSCGFVSSLITIPSLTASGALGFVACNGQKQEDQIAAAVAAVVAFFVAIGAEKTARNFSESVVGEDNKKLSYALNRLGFTLGGLGSFCAVGVGYDNYCREHRC